MNVLATVRAVDDAAHTESQGPRVLLEIASAGGCPHCRSGRGCGGLPATSTARRLTLTLAELRDAGWGDSEPVPVPGQTLTLHPARAHRWGLPPAVWAYALPLLTLLIGAAAGNAMAVAPGSVDGIEHADALRDLTTAAGMVAGLLVGLLAWKSLARHIAADPNVGAYRISQALINDETGQTALSVTGDRTCAPPPTRSS